MPKKQIKVRNKRKVKKEISTLSAFLYVSAFFFLLLVTIFSFHYRHGVQAYLCIKFNVFCNEQAMQNVLNCKTSVGREVTRFNIRNIEVMDRHEFNIFGIDVSQYQGNVNWSEIVCIEDNKAIRFVIARATAGVDKTDNTFAYNWKEIRANKFIRGAYHYYRPDEDPVLQAQNFIDNVTLKSGDLPPILDIEVEPKVISKDELLTNLKIWLDMIEKHYKIKPIVYSGQKYYEKNLIHNFSDYLVWVANYNFFVEKMNPNWMMWQFTEKGYVNGIKGHVDLNIYNGTYDDLVKITLK